MRSFRINQQYGGLGVLLKFCNSTDLMLIVIRFKVWQSYLKPYRSLEVVPDWSIGPIDYDHAAFNCVRSMLTLVSSST
jgi:hypothetical protein